MNVHVCALSFYTYTHTHNFSMFKNFVKYIKSLPVLENATSTWTNVNDIEYTLGTDTLYQNSATGCSEYNNCSENTYTLAKMSNKKARMITIQETMH